MSAHSTLVAAMAEVARNLPADHGLRFYLADLLAGRSATPRLSAVPAGDEDGPQTHEAA